MAEICDWETWEQRERRKFYKSNLLRNMGELPDDLSEWKRECDEHIERGSVPKMVA